MKLFLHSRQQQHRYSCVSDNSCVAGLAAANAHAHSGPGTQCGRPGSVSEITSGRTREVSSPSLLRRTSPLAGGGGGEGVLTKPPDLCLSMGNVCLISEISDDEMTYPSRAMHMLELSNSRGGWWSGVV